MNSPGNHPAIQAARSLMKERDWRGASILWEEAIRSDPDQAWNHMYPGSCHYELRNPQAALACFTAAGSLAPHSAAPLWLQGDLIRAEALYRAAVALEPEDESARLNLERFLSRASAAS